MERINKSTRREQTTKRVNAYTATETTLVGLQGIGVRTLDYIWNYRVRGERIDVEHVRSLNPKVFQVLDLAVPGGCDPEPMSSSSDSGYSSRKHGKKQSTPTIFKETTNLPNRLLAFQLK